MENGLKKIEIENYQSLKDVKIELGQFTVISGATDSGKSAFFRAVKALVTNESGTDYITVGEKKTVVKADNVEWIQSKTVNRYRIGEDEEWNNFGRGVPDKVRECLRMQEFVFGEGVKELLNFSGQLEPAFIVQGNPADNAKIIGSISNIHDVYNALREAEKDTKNIKKRITEGEEKLEGYRETIKKDEAELEELDKRYRELKGIMERAELIDSEIDILLAVREELKKVDKKIKSASVRYKVLKAIDFRSGIEKCDEFNALSRINDRIASIKGEIRVLEPEIQARWAFDGSEGINILKKIEKLVEVQQIVTGVYKKQRRLEKKIESAEVEIEKWREKIDEIDVCEVCGAKKQYWNL